MTNWKPARIKDDIRMWIICTAISEEHDLIDKMKRNEDGSYPVFFSVGGVELNFDNVAKRIEECFNDAITEQAYDMLNEKYDNLISELHDMQERINNQKKKFKYEWE